MMNHRYSVLIPVLLLMLLSLCGCKQDITKSLDNKDKNEHNFSVSSLAFSCDESIVSSSYSYCGGKLYYASHNLEKDDGTIYNIHCYDTENEIDGILFQTKAEAGDMEAPDMFNTMEVTGNIIRIFYNTFVYYDDNNAGYKGITRIEYDMKGNEVKRTVFDSDKDIAQQVECKSTGNEDTYVSVLNNKTGSSCYIRYDESGRITGKVLLNNVYTYGYLNDSDNLIVYERQPDSARYGVVDFDNNRIDSEQLRGLTETGTSANIVNESADTYILRDADYIYEYDRNKHTLKRTVDFAACNVNGSDVVYTGKIREDAFLCVSQDEDTELLLLEDSGQLPDKEIIRIAGVYECMDELLRYINRYNRNNNTYRLEYMGYGLEDHNAATAATELMRDILKGNTPDIYILDNMDEDNLIRKGLIEDLTPYFDSDNTVNNDFFIDGYLDATDREGCHYVLMKNFKLCVLLGMKKNVGEYSSGWNVEKAIELCKNVSDDMAIVDYEYGAEGVMSVYGMLMNSVADDYIDINKGGAGFDAAAYQDMLELCRIINDTPADSGQEWEDGMNDGKLLFHADDILGVESIQYNDICCGGSAVYMGYPMNNGSRIRLKSETGTFAMSSQAKNKDVVWSVLKDIMTGDYARYDRSVMSGIPVSHTEFERMIKCRTAKKPYEDTDGVVVEPSDIIYGNGISIGRATEEDVNRLKSLIKAAEYCSDHYTLLSITEEHAEDYMYGDKDMADTLDIIEDKISKYIEENK